MPTPSPVPLKVGAYAFVYGRAHARWLLNMGRLLFGDSLNWDACFSMVAQSETLTFWWFLKIGR